MPASAQTDWKFGSHLSVAGGLHLALGSAETLGMNTCQIFTKNANQWNCKALEPTAIKAFAEKRESLAIEDVYAHASYLINLATPDQALWQKSIDALKIELQRADALQLSGVVVHPGAFVKSSEPEGLARIIEAIELIFADEPALTTKLLLENTAGQGTTLGWQISQLADVLRRFKSEDRLGICLDSCHAFAAGYDLSQPDGLTRLVDELAEGQLLDRLHVIHMNDSKKACGSRVDRHEHLGLGHIGLAGLKQFVTHAAFRRLPMILETEKGLNDEGEDWDAVNLRQLCGFTTESHV